MIFSLNSLLQNPDERQFSKNYNSKEKIRKFKNFLKIEKFMFEDPTSF